MEDFEKNVAGADRYVERGRCKSACPRQIIDGLEKVHLAAVESSASLAP